ncbi:MAG TPA: ABC transporter permease, partial [Candidatus Limnocylindrales bacterium]
AQTEEAANGMTSIVQFPLMFLSGIFFPLEIMPTWLRTVATFMPLTYLGDALRQVMVGGTPFVPLWADMAILGGWLVACLAISARFFRWQ